MYMYIIYWEGLGWAPPLHPTPLHLLGATRLLLDYWLGYNVVLIGLMLINTNPEEGGHYASGKESEGSR